jgi:RimJ/RimL family protein N-acetyltransferase
VAVAPEVRIEGALVRLRPPNDSDVPHFVRWYSDPDVLHWLHMTEGPAPTEAMEQERIDNARNDPYQVLWIIETNEGRVVGNVGLLQIDMVHGRAWLGITIGEKDCWSHGYGTDAIRLLLQYAFNSLGLRRIQLITDADNERGIRCYEKCGFYQEALLREHRLRYGKPLDMVQMAVLRGEWKLDGGG